MLKKLLLPLFLGLLVFAGQLYAQDGGYDKYASVYSAGTAPESGSRISSDFLTYPFAILRWPIDKSLVLVEKYHLDTKTQWAYDTLINHGLTPHLSILNPLSADYGLDVDWIRLLNQRGRLADWKANSWIYYAKDKYFQVGSELGWQDVTNTGLGGSGIFQYETRPQEFFYGIGPDTSKGNGTSYKMETTTLGVKGSYDPRPTVSGDVFFTYRNINITNGTNGGKGIIDEVFGPIAGLSGDDILTYGTEWIHDSRNHRELSTRGGMQRLAFSYNEGVNSSKASYFKYVAEGSQYFRLGSDRRVFAFHAYGEHNAEVNGEVPFYDMARLGGYAGRPQLGQTLRGYDDGRFYDKSQLLFNVEYRYTIWEHRDFKVDSVLFTDVGQVFGNFDELEWNNFKESYGLGFRFSVANVLLLSVEGAHGNEGSTFYVTSRTPF